MKQQRLTLSGFKKTTRTDGNEAGQHPGHQLITSWLKCPTFGPYIPRRKTLEVFWGGFNIWYEVSHEKRQSIIPNRVSFGRLLASHGFIKTSKVFCEKHGKRVWFYALPVRHA